MEKKTLSNKGEVCVQKNLETSLFKGRNESIQKAIVHFSSFRLEENKQSALIDA